MLSKEQLLVPKKNATGLVQPAAVKKSTRLRQAPRKKSGQAGMTTFYFKV
jgi:hypothetical protein